jgi:DNA repair exonuclease SbcCD ATPase subunit
MNIAQLIEQAAQRSLDLSNDFDGRYDDYIGDYSNYRQDKQACRVSFEVNGQKYRVLRQSEWQRGRPEGKVNTRYFIVKTVGKRVIKEKDSPVKLTKILEEGSRSALKNQDMIRERLGSILLPC